MQQPPYTFPYGPNNPDLPDLSAMMFPSTEPFTYPNQPLTTFENYQFPNGDNVEPQMFPSMPFDQWQMPVQNQRQMLDRDGRQGVTSNAATGMSWNGQPGVPQAQAFSDINLHDIFGGGEWSSMQMDQTFR